MFFAPQTYNVTNVAISGVGGGAGAAFLTPFANMFDARTGTVCSMQWGTGTQNTSSYVQLVLTIVNPTGGTPRIGVIHIANLVGLPEGVKIDVQAGTYIQRTVAGRRGELNAIILPTSVLNTGTVTIRIYNDVNGTFPIVNGQVFGIGEILCAPVSVWPLLIDDSPPSEVPVDPTAWTRTDGGQLWQYQRKPYSVISVKAGRFPTTGAVGGAAYATVDNGMGVKIDGRTLLYTLATCGVCSFIDIPHKGFNDRPALQAAGGGYFDAAMVQVNAMLCRPSSIKELSMDKFPYWGFALDMMEAT